MSGSFKNRNHLDRTYLVLRRPKTISAVVGLENRSLGVPGADGFASNQPRVIVPCDRHNYVNRCYPPLEGSG